VYKAADPEAMIILGAVIDPSMGNEVKITLIATGFEQQGAIERGALRGRAPSVGDEVRPLRPRPRPFGGGEPDEGSPFEGDETEIDIPPFLRRQRRPR
jgi:cell division protein FtsZ